MFRQKRTYLFAKYEPDRQWLDWETAVYDNETGPNNNQNNGSGGGGSGCSWIGIIIAIIILYLFFS